MANTSKSMTADAIIVGIRYRNRAMDLLTSQIEDRLIDLRLAMARVAR